MPTEAGGKTASGGRFVLLGLFFGAGFLLGFLTCRGMTEARYAAMEAARFAREEAPLSATSTTVLDAGAPLSEDARASGDIALSAGEILFTPAEPSARAAGTSAEPPADAPAAVIGLVLEEHRLEEDENGLFIAGTVANRSHEAFDAARIVFDLCDNAGAPFNAVTDTAMERMEPGDVWGFTIYIPYAEMDLFASYRLQNLIGVKK